MKTVFWTAIAFIAFGILSPPIYSAEENPCLQCHAQYQGAAKNTHAALAGGCLVCHKSVEGKNHPEQKDSIILVQPMPKLCYGCHEESKFRGKSLHPVVGGGKCTVCHNPHQSNYNSLLVQEAPDLCYTCHDKSKFEGKYGHTLIGMCTSCHNPHASDYSNLLIKGIPDICFTCHDKAQFTKKYKHIIVEIPNGCTICHNPHAENNKNLLLQPVVDLCTSCHAAKADGRHILAVAHLGTGESIHPVQGMPDPSDPSKQLSCISCHNPHGSDFHKLFVQKTLCERCHKEDF
jgi:predicted CXXCH cytochrome family protein